MVRQLIYHMQGPSKTYPGAPRMPALHDHGGMRLATPVGGDGAAQTTIARDQLVKKIA
jgi:hypothetical protein